LQVGQKKKVLGELLQVCKLFGALMTPVLNRVVIVPASDLRDFSEQSSSLDISLQAFVFMMNIRGKVFDKRLRRNLAESVL